MAGPPREEVRQKYQAGATIQSLAKEYDCGYEAVRRRLSGITRLRGSKPDRPETIRAMLLRRRPESLSISELARQEGIDRTYLYRIIRQELGGNDNWFKETNDTQ